VADLDRVVVVLNLKRAPVGPAAARPSTTGLGSSAKVKLLAGQTGYLAVYAFDHSGNFSKAPLRKKVTLAGLISLRPLSGSTLRTTSAEAHVEGLEGHDVLQRAALPQRQARARRLADEGLLRDSGGTLKSGNYVWYVWPAVQHSGAAPTFGKLIGRATFAFKK